MIHIRLLILLISVILIKSSDVGTPKILPFKENIKNIDLPINKVDSLPVNKATILPANKQTNLPENIAKPFQTNIPKPFEYQQSSQLINQQVGYINPIPKALQPVSFNNFSPKFAGPNPNFQQPFIGQPNNFLPGGNFNNFNHFQSQGFVPNQNFNQFRYQQSYGFVNGYNRYMVQPQGFIPNNFIPSGVNRPFVPPYQNYVANNLIPNGINGPQIIPPYQGYVHKTFVPNMGYIPQQNMNAPIITPPPQGLGFNNFIPKQTLGFIPNSNFNQFYPKTFVPYAQTFKPIDKNFIKKDNLHFGNFSKPVNKTIIPISEHNKNFSIINSKLNSTITIPLDTKKAKVGNFSKTIDFEPIKNKTLSNITAVPVNKTNTIRTQNKNSNQTIQDKPQQNSTKVNTFWPLTQK